MASLEEPYLPKFGAAPRDNSVSELGDAFDRFNTGLKQLIVQRSLNGASQEIQNLRQQEASDTEIRKRQNELAQNLGQQMLGFGYPAAQTALAQKVLAPPVEKPQFTNIAELAAYGTPEQKQSAIEFFKQYKPPKEANPVADELAQARLEKLKGDADDKTNKRFSAMADALDPNRPRGGEFGRQVQFVNNADRVLALMKQFPDGNMPPAQVAEFATATASLIGSGGHSAESTINRFVPKTGSGAAADVVQYLTNNPKGAGQQGFIKLMADSAEREKALAQSKIKNVQHSRISAFSDLQKKDPERFKFELQDHGIDLDEYEQFKDSARKTGVKQQQGPSEDQQAIEWAKNEIAKNPKEPRAIKILQLHGLQ